MSGLVICFFVWVFKNEISSWISDAIAEGIRRSKKEK